MDKKELKEKVAEIFTTPSKSNMKKVLDSIDQLDELEVLSQERKNLDHQVSLKVEQARQDGYMKGKEAWVRDVLRNRGFKRGRTDYAVIEKPVIPNFVADILEENTFEDLPTAFEELFSANAGHYYGGDVCKWVESNEETFARAWLDGYTVEEKKYYVLDKEDDTLLKKSRVGKGVAKSVGTNIYSAKKWKDEEKYQLTEQEIKYYDPRYMAFAEPVEELEK